MSGNTPDAIVMLSEAKHLFRILRYARNDDMNIFNNLNDLL